MWPRDACWLRMPGERHAGPPRKSNGSGPRRFCRVLRVLRVLSVLGVCSVRRVLGFRGWQTASLDAHKKPLMWPWDACWLRMPGERHAGPPRKSNGSGPRRFCRVLRVLSVLRVWSFRRVLGVHWQAASLDAHKKPLMWPWDACWLRMPGERHAGPRLEEAMDLALG